MAMELTYSLGAEDFVAFQLHSAGASRYGRKRRLFARGATVAGIALFGASQWAAGKEGLAIAFFCGALVLGIVYPWISKRIYRRHFRRQVAENYRERIDSHATLRLEDGGMVSLGEDGEGVIRYSAVDQLAEIETLGLIKLKAGMSLLLPRDQIGDAKLREFMTELGRRCDLELEDQRGRRWR